MKDIELVVKIPEEIRLALINNIQLSLDQQSICDSCIKQAIINGIPLSKGHGRILDEKDILDTENNDGGWYDLVDLPDYIAGVPEIVEADKESEDKE